MAPQVHLRSQGVPNVDNGEISLMLVLTRELARSAADQSRSAFVQLGPADGAAGAVDFFDQVV